MILSVSRRTDIPAFYSNWFFEKLNQKEQLPAILFVFSRNFSREMLDYFAKDGENLTNDEEKEQIEQIVEEYTSKKYIGADLNVEALKKGYAIHNAGIIPGQKELIEELFQKKLLKVVIATETLAAGINMPAKTVVISSPYKPCDEDTDAGKLLENPPKVLMEYSDDNELFLQYILIVLLTFLLLIALTSVKMLVFE